MTDADRELFQEFTNQLVAALTQFSGQPSPSGAGAQSQQEHKNKLAVEEGSSFLMLARNIQQAGGSLPPVFQQVIYQYTQLVTAGRPLWEVVKQAGPIAISAFKSLLTPVRTFSTLLETVVNKKLGKFAEKLGVDEHGLRHANQVFRRTGDMSRAQRAYGRWAARNGVQEEDVQRLLSGKNAKLFTQAIKTGGSSLGRAGVMAGAGLKAALTAIGGFVSSTVPPALAMTAVMAGMDAWEKYNRKLDGQMKARTAQADLLSKTQVAGIQHESRMRQALFKAEEEMDRKRFENLRTLSEMKTKMNEGDLAMQERLQSIEKQRLAAQKQGELRKQNTALAKETAQHQIDYMRSEGQVKDNSQLDTGTLSTLTKWTGFLWGRKFGQNDIVDERGNRVDESVERAVADAGLLKRTQDRKLKEIMNQASHARAAAIEAFSADVNELVSAYESFHEAVASLQVGPLSERLNNEIEALDEKYKNIEKFREKNEASLTYAKVLSEGWQKGLESGAIQYNAESGEYVFDDWEGNARVVHSESEYNEIAGESGARQAMSLRDQYQKMDKLYREEANLQERKVAYEQASVALVQEQVKRQEEILKNLRDAATKNYQSDMSGLFGMGNRKTAQEMEEIFGNRRDEMQRDLILSSSRFAGDAQAAEDYKVNADIQIQRDKDIRKLNAQMSKEWYDLRKKQAIELYEIEHKNVLEEHKVRLQNETKIFQTYIDVAKAQRDAYFRMLEKQMSRDIISVSGYGRSQSDVAQELQLSRIGQYYDQLNTNFESNYNMQKSASDADFESAVIADQSEFNRRQAEERQKFEEEAIKNKFNYERDLAKQEHQVRIELIKAEYDYRRGLDQIEKDKARNNVREMDNLAAQRPKEEMDKLVDSVFKDKKYEDLTKEEKEEFFDTVATQQRGMLNEAAEASGKRLADYRDSRGNALEGDELYAAVKADAIARYNAMSDEEKNSPQGQRLHDVIEDLGTGVSDAIRKVADAAEQAAQQLRAAEGGKLDESTAKSQEGFDRISRQASENEVKLEKERADLRNRQDTETAEHEEQVKHTRSAYDASWDDWKQRGKKELELRQKQDEENYKLNIRQIARHETASTDAFAAKLGASSGAEYSAAILKGQNEQAFNNFLDDLEVRHADEIATAKANGASESDIMKMQARHQLEYKEAENQKKISDTMLQRRIGAETGSTSDVMGMWEQIQASAFGHMEDPQVAAIDSLREQQREQGEAMLRASLDQAGRMSDEVAYSYAIATNTARLLEEARKDKGSKSETVQNTVIAQQGLAARNDGPKHLVAPGIAAPMGR